MMIAATWWDGLNTGTFLQNSLWQWLGLLGVLLGSLVVGKIAAWILDRQGRRFIDHTKLHLLGLLLRAMARTTTMLAIAGGLYIAAMFMNLNYIQTVGSGEKAVHTPISILPFWLNVCRTIAMLAAGWFIYRLIDIVEYYLLRVTSRTDTTLDDQLVPMIRKSLRVLLVIVVILFIAQNVFEMNIGALVASLGIGGLAFALAAKDMLANFFGSITIFADRPFTMGDRVKIGAYDGVVEEVGFRTTRLRLLNGHVVVLPNGMVANQGLENISKRPFIRRSLEVAVTYDTSPEKLQQAIEIIRQILADRKANFPADKPGWAHFTEFNADNLGIAVMYWFAPPDWAAYLDFNHEFNTELLRRFNAEGIEFAFPTRTLYMKSDTSNP